MSETPRQSLPNLMLTEEVIEGVQARYQKGLRALLLRGFLPAKPLACQKTGNPRVVLGLLFHDIARITRGFWRNRPALRLQVAYGKGKVSGRFFVPPGHFPDRPLQ